MILFKNKLFVGSSLLFLIILIICLWKIYPPLVGKIEDQRQQSAALDQQIAAFQQYLTIVSQLQANSAEVDALNQKAALALPPTLDSENLILQLDGLLASLKVAGNLTVPFDKTKASSTMATPTPGAAKPPSNSGSITISGPFDYGNFVNLLTALKTFSRWNQVTSFSFTQEGDKPAAAVTAYVFYKPGQAVNFSGKNPNFLAQARTTFGSLTSYAAVPNVSTQGSYGRANPFAAVK